MFVNVAVLAMVAAGVVATAAPALAGTASGPVVAVGAENEYADVISQIGVAEAVSKAELIVQNGVGYDTFMNKIEAASPRRGRDVVVAQQLLGLSSNIFNPHLWYDPGTMPLVAKAVATDLSKLEPAHGAYFRARDSSFVKSLQPWLAAIASLKKRYSGTPVAVTEPVADYMLMAAGADIVTPQSLEAAIMNGTDHKVKVFLYNQQVTDSLTASFLADANKAHVPVVGVYETMPVPGYHYQSWMLAEVDALQAALVKGTSTVRL